MSAISSSVSVAVARIASTTLSDLVEWALNATSEPDSWQSLIDRVRELFPLLLLADAIYLDARLAREPFEKSISDRAMELLRHLNQYMESRNLDGSDSESLAGRTGSR